MSSAGASREAGGQAKEALPGQPASQSRELLHLTDVVGHLLPTCAFAVSFFVAFRKTSQIARACLVPWLRSLPRASISRRSTPKRGES